MGESEQRYRRVADKSRPHSNQQPHTSEGNESNKGHGNVQWASVAMSWSHPDMVNYATIFEVSVCHSLVLHNCNLSLYNYGMLSVILVTL